MKGVLADSFVDTKLMNFKLSIPDESEKQTGNKGIDVDDDDDDDDDDDYDDDDDDDDDYDD